MRVVFIPAKSDVDVRLSTAALKKLPKLRFGIVTTIQHLDNIGPVLAQVKDSVLAGQVLGCNVLNAEGIADDVDAFLYVGTGEFHPLSVAYKAKKPVWVWNPVSKLLNRIDDVVVERFEKRKQGLFAKFLMAKNVGIIVSLKLGQLNFSRALQFAQRKDKNYYVFLADALDFSELENFPFIDCWVNTACPRIAEDLKGIVNLDDLAGFLEFKFRKAEKVMWDVRL